jgi:4-amino-4-deoxy-L-arabinose transferase-like glycosyltransferase
MFPRLIIAMRILVLSSAGYYIVAYIAAAILRISYPFELEWMEGSMVEHVQRVAAGTQLYVQPSLDFVPAIYAPMFYYISAIVATFVGDGFFPLRLVAFSASLGCFLMIYLFVRRESGGHFVAFLATGLFAATYKISGFWFDVGRVDCLFLLFVLIAAYLIRFHSSLLSDLLAGALMSLGILSKQNGLVVAIALAIYCILTRRVRAAAFIGSILLVVGIFTLYLNKVSDGWYMFYVFDLPQQHGYAKAFLVMFWVRDLLAPMFLATVMTLLYVFVQRGTGNRQQFKFYALFFGGLIAASWMARLKLGGYFNVLIPAYAALAIGFGLAAQLLINYLRDKSLNDTPRLATETSSVGWPRNSGLDSKNLLMLCYILLILPFSHLFYNPAYAVPTKQDVQAGRDLVHQIEYFPGDVFLPYHGYIPSLAGKPPHAHIAAIRDIFNGKDTRLQTELLKEIEDAIQQRRFSAIILDESPDRMLFRDVGLEKHYMLQGTVFKDREIFCTRSGGTLRPEGIYLPKADGLE